MISLIVPTRDRPHFLAQCLHSLREHGYLDRIDYEVIVVDNNSETSATRDLCSRYSVDYVFEPMEGRAAALNSGVRRSIGDLVAFTDDDVVVQSSDWLDRLASNCQDHPEIGYVSGNVRALKVETSAQRAWEAKGGLSKGMQRRQFDQSFFHRFRLVGVPVRLIAAGANSMIPRHVLAEVGNHDELFGPGSLVGHGESLEICYKVMSHGYVAVYDPDAVVFHQHPGSWRELGTKLFYYGIGDTAVHTKFFLSYGDLRSLSEAVAGRQLYVFGRLLRSLVGLYPLPPIVLIAQMAGNAIGPAVYLRASWLQSHRSSGRA